MQTIEDFMRQRENCLKEYKKENQTLNEEMKILMQNPLIREYLSLKEKIEHQENKIKLLNEEYIYMYQNHCHHPIYIMIGGFDGYYKTNYTDICCVICEKVINKPLEEKYNWLKEIFENKRLIAKYIEINQRTRLPKFTNMQGYTYDNIFADSNPIENIRKEYLEIYLSLPNDESAEDILFDTYCKSDYQRYQNNKAKVLKKN